MKDNIVYVVSNRWEDGSECIVCATEEVAYRVAYDIIADTVAEDRDSYDDNPELLEAIDLRIHRQTVKLWNDNQNFIDISQQSIIF